VVSYLVLKALAISIYYAFIDVCVFVSLCCIHKYNNELFWLVSLVLWSGLLTPRISLLLIRTWKLSGVYQEKTKPKSFQGTHNQRRISWCVTLAKTLHQYVFIKSRRNIRNCLFLKTTVTIVSFLNEVYIAKVVFFQRIVTYDQLRRHNTVPLALRPYPLPRLPLLSMWESLSKLLNPP